MKPLLLVPTCLLLACVSTLCLAGQSADGSNARPASTHVAPADAPPPTPPPPPRQTPDIERTLRAMDDASTQGHPDLFGQFAGMRRLFEGDYQGAMKYFRIGSRYADKMSQLSIAMMYLNGRGVRKDRASACAWITLAAERGYPSYVNARDRICAALAPAQRTQANTMLAALMAEFGDAVAKPRMKLALISARNSLTGSHLGHDSGVKVMGLNADNPTRCGGNRLVLGGVEIPREGCGRYDPSLLDPNRYFAARDAQWFGTVTVGKMIKADPPPSTAPGASDHSH